MWMHSWMLPLEKKALQNVQQLKKRPTPFTLMVT